MVEHSYDPIYYEIFENVKGIITNAKNLSKELRDILSQYIRSVEVSPSSEKRACYAIDGTLTYDVGTGFVVYNVAAEAIPINTRGRVSIENMFLMIPTRDIKDRVANRMHTLESVAGIKSTEGAPEVILVDGLISTQIFKLLRNLYTRFRLGSGDKEDFTTTINDISKDIEDHWYTLLDQFKLSQKISQNEKIKSLFFSEAGSKEVLDALANYFVQGDSIESHKKHIAIENAMLTLEVLEGIITREMLIKEAKNHEVNVVGIAKKSSGYSLRNSREVLRILGVGSEVLENIQNVSDIILATLLLDQNKREFVVSPLFYVYYMEHITKRIRDSSELVKDIAPNVASLAELATKIHEKHIRIPKDYEALSEEMVRHNFYVGYARFAPHQRPYKFEVLLHKKDLEDLMGFVFSISKSGYPQPLSLADAAVKKPYELMPTLSGVLSLFVKKHFSKEDEKVVADLIINQLIGPYRGHLARSRSTFTS